MMRFEIPQKELLNSNSMPNQWFLKSKLASALRTLGAESALKVHPQAKEAKERFKAIRAEEDLKSRKSRTRKKMTKTGATEEEILEKLQAIENEFAPEIPSNEIVVEYPFTKFTVDIVIEAPTRRRFDPPNLYPTVKPIIDGMTDASFWDDDSFDQLTSMSFKAGGLSGVPKTFTVILHISSVEG